MADTLMYFKKLEAAGFTRKQAEVQVEMVSQLNRSEFPDKPYVDGKFADVDTHFAHMDLRFAEVDKRFAAVDARFDRMEIEMARIGDRVTIRLGAVMIACSGFIVAALGLMLKAH